MDDDDEFIHAFGQASDQYNMQRQGYQDQINAIDEQMKTMTGQMEQLRIRKQDLEKQRDSVKKAPTTQQPTMQAAPAQAPAGASGPAPAPGMAAMSPLSFRKLS
jgi:phage shock protein A